MKKALLFSIALNVLVIGIVIGKRIYYHQPKPGKPTIVMYGDSRIAMGDWVTGLKRSDIYNAGIGGTTTRNLFDSLEAKVLKYHPSICFIQAGINDIRSQVSLDSTIFYYGRIIDKLKENNISVVINSVIPVSKDPFQFVVPDSVINNNVIELNDLLRRLATSKDVEYLDINLHLAENNHFKLKYTLDGVHVNPLGIAVWSKEITGCLTRHNL